MDTPNDGGITVWQIITGLSALVAALSGLVWKLIEHRILKLESSATKIADMETKVTVMWNEFLKDVKSRSTGVGK